MASVSTEATVCATTDRRKRKCAQSRTRPRRFLPLKNAIAKRRCNAHGNFIRKINPSAYSLTLILSRSRRSCRAEFISTVSPIISRRCMAVGGTLFFNNCKWRDGLVGADRLFQTCHAEAPDPERAAKEWKRVREGLFASETARRFAAITAQTHAEFPFSWSVNQDFALEGVIDFLLIEEKETRALLIDWKTNNISSGERRSCACVTVRSWPPIGKPSARSRAWRLSAGSVLDCARSMLLYETEELAAEWKRLEQLPPDRTNRGNFDSLSRKSDSTPGRFCCEKGRAMERQPCG